MKKNEKGFSTVEIIIVLSIFGLIAASGWLVWTKQKQPENSTANTSAIQQPSEAVIADGNKKSVSSKEESFSSYGIKLKIEVPEGWEAKGISGTPEDYEYLVDITNKEKGIQLSLQITKFESSTYKQNILGKFDGFNNKEFYFTKGVDDTPGDELYEQIGISACENGHCVTKINDTYNLNANITPVDTAKSKVFNGSEENLELIKRIFSSIKIEN